MYSCNRNLMHLVCLYSISHAGTTQLREEVLHGQHEKALSALTILYYATKQLDILLKLVCVAESTFLVIIRVYLLGRCRPLEFCALLCSTSIQGRQRLIRTALGLSVGLTRKIILQLFSLPIGRSSVSCQSKVGLKWSPHESNLKEEHSAVVSCCRVPFSKC